MRHDEQWWKFHYVLRPLQKHHYICRTCGSRRNGINFNLSRSEIGQSSTNSWEYKECHYVCTLNPLQPKYSPQSKVFALSWEKRMKSAVLISKLKKNTIIYVPKWAMLIPSLQRLVRFLWTFHSFTF